MGNDGEGGGKDRGNWKVHITGLPAFSFWANHDGCFSLELLSPAQCEEPALSEAGELPSSGEMGEDDDCRELHHVAKGLYKTEVPFSNSALN